MFSTVRKWVSYVIETKIRITIITPAKDIERIVDSVSETEVPAVVTRTQSNLRFIRQDNIDHNGKATGHWCTEEYYSGRWHCIIDSIACDRDKALDLHVKIAKKVSLQPTKTKTVLWQGLDKEETATWVELQR